MLVAAAFVFSFIFLCQTLVVTGFYCGLVRLPCSGMGFFNIVIWAFVTDVIDYHELINWIAGRWNRLLNLFLCPKSRTSDCRRCWRIRDCSSWLYGSTKDTNTRDIRWNLCVGNISSWGNLSVSSFDINFLVSVKQVSTC